VAPKNPLGRLADSAIKSLKDPMGTAGKVVEQAKGSAAFGKMVAEQVSKSAVTKASETVGAVTGLAGGRKTRSEEAAPSTAGTPLRSVPDVNEPGHTPAENKAEHKSSGPDKEHGDPMRPAKKAPAKKAAAKEAPAKKAAAKKAPSKQSAASPADVAKAVEAAVAEDPNKTAATPAKKTATKKSAAKTPGAKTAPAKKAAPGDKLPTKKAAEKPAKKAAPKTAQQLADDTEGVTTPVRTQGAAPGNNPDTAEADLNQPGTEEILEASTAKAIASETAALRKAAERNPE
jgi:hypothetical protein